MIDYKASLILKKNLDVILINLIGLLLITFLPAISHILPVPIYLLEPMRWIVISAVIFANKKNAYILAIALPLISYLLSSHPYLIKSILISFELLANVFLISIFINWIRNVFLVAFTSILLSKLVYYSLKFLFIKFMIIEGDLISTPLVIQFVIAITMGIYVSLFYKNFKRNFTKQCSR
jgi:hypothetical protein